MRDRLIELIQNFADGTYTSNGIIVDGTRVDDVADYFLANGVIVQPCLIKIDEDSLCIAKDGVVFDEIRPEHVKDIIDAFNRQRVTIHNQDEMIRALINAQETLQKAMAEKDEEIERLKSGHILYDDKE